jgi:UDP-galactopyranose mutase
MYYDYLIVGAGLFGATFAHEMNQKGKTCLVIDKRPHIGGNIYTESQHSIDVHKYGAHIFHTSDQEVWEYINQFTEFNHYRNEPIAIYKDELYNLPFNMNTFSKMWGIKTPAEAKKIIHDQIKELEGQPITNLEQQALHLVGYDIYTKLIKGYTEKQWGKDCTELPAFIINRLPVRFTYNNNYFKDPYQGIPIHGYTRIVENMLKDIPVKRNTDFFEAKNVWDKTKEITYGTVLFTGMIDAYFNYIYGALEYRSLEFQTEYYPDIDNYQGNAVVNYTEREIPYTRILEHKHFAFHECKGTILTKEFSRAFTPGDEPYYPINDEKNNALFLKYKALAKKEPSTIFGGRLGSYKYYDMDKVIRAALDLVKTHGNSQNGETYE